MNSPSPTTQNPPSLIQAQRSPLMTYQKRRPLHRPELEETILRFAPLAWLKLRFFLHAGETEVGFFGISHKDDLLYIEDLVAPRQTTSVVTVNFEDGAVADYFDDCADREIAPPRCGRIWIHTHPGQSPNPSTVDEETFARVFGTCDWAIMAIVARSGATYARLSFSAGPGGSVNIPIRVDWESFPQELLNREGTLDELFTGWIDEYGKNVFPESFGAPATQPGLIPNGPSSHQPLLDRRDMLDEWYDELILDERIEQLYLDSMREEVFP
jgi:hypothetical protein